MGETWLVVVLLSSNGGYLGYCSEPKDGMKVFVKRGFREGKRRCRRNLLLCLGRQEWRLDVCVAGRDGSY
jgi:hypothetical protein